MPKRIRSAMFVALASAAVVALAGCAPELENPMPATAPASASPEPAATGIPTPTPTPTFDRSARSIDDPESIWVVSNKLRPLNPVAYRPADLVEAAVPHVYTPLLRKPAADAVVELFDAARAEAGLKLQSQSAFRSYETQVSVYNTYVANHGQARADISSARPGHSEHQTGLTLDISSVPAQCTLDACFGDTPHGKWLAENSWRFGFVLRYPEGMTDVTGFKYEPWHFRYVGVELATELHEQGISTLEEFFGLPPAPSYPPKAE